MKSSDCILCVLLTCGLVSLTGCAEQSAAVRIDSDVPEIGKTETKMDEQPTVEVKEPEVPVVEAKAEPEVKVEAKAPETKTTDYTNVDISAAFNANAVGGEDGLDGYGSFYPADAMPTGSKSFEQGIVFNLPDYKAAEKNVVTTDGQTVNVAAGKYVTLYILAAGTNGLQAETMELAYGDTKADATLKISDWCSDASAGEMPAMKFARAGKNEAIECRLFIQKIALDATKDLTAITLPKSKDVHIFAMTLGK